MERKFKVGERVKDKSTGLSCDVVYVHEDSDLPYLIVGKTTGGVCINWRRSEQIELIPIKKLPEPKYNVGDKVRVSAEGIEPFEVMVTSWCTSGGRYYYTFEIVGGTAGAHSVGDKPLELKYKKGDKIWNKKDKRVDIIDAISTSGCGYVYVVALGGFLGVYKLSDIEPYTGQDKVKTEEAVREYYNKEAEKFYNNTPDQELTSTNTDSMHYVRVVPVHPYTVILKSGVKVGVTAEAKQELTGCISSTRGEPSGVFNTIVFQSKEYSFCVSEIAAIVPTENIVK